MRLLGRAPASTLRYGVYDGSTACTRGVEHTLADVSELTFGFIGLGNMGAPMAANLSRAGRRLLVYDLAGTSGRAPSGAALAEDNRAVARRADAVFLSLPDGDAVREVAEEIASVSEARIRCAIDTSTVGIAAAREFHERLARAGIEYLDAPVSGGVSGARSGSVALMFAGSDAAFTTYRPVLEDIAARVVHVGREPGLGQAMKLLNNFLSAVAMTATSEAIALGERHGLDMATMVEVLNASSGRNSATADKFPNRILSGTYDTGFTSRLLEKDLRLYLEALQAAGGEAVLAPSIHEVWRRLEASETNADITRVYPFVKEGRWRGNASG